MKLLLKTCLIITVVLGFYIGESQAQSSPTAKEMIQKADDNMEGSSSTSVMTMSIVRPTWTRTLEFKNWVKGSEYALTLVTAPAKEKGQTFLKRGNDMWSFLPKIGRMIKLPPSMMSQGWMGSDYTNDDVLNETSLTEDYQHSFIGEDQLENRDAKIIDMKPKEESNIVWGKVVTWVSNEQFLFLKTEYYDEDDFLVRTELFQDFKMMDNRLVPTKYIIIPAENPDQKTIVEIKDMKFDVPLKDAFFSQQNMKRIR